MKKILLLLAALLTLSAAAEAQNSAYHDVAWANVSGFSKVVPGALITVCTQTAGGAPCSPKTNIYQAQASIIPTANPFNADSNGNFTFWAPSGTTVTVSITGVGVIGYSYQVT